MNSSSPYPHQPLIYNNNNIKLDGDGSQKQAAVSFDNSLLRNNNRNSCCLGALNRATIIKSAATAGSVGSPSKQQSVLIDRSGVNSTTKTYMYYENHHYQGSSYKSIFQTKLLLRRNHQDVGNNSKKKYNSNFL